MAHAGLSLGYSIMAHTPKPIPDASRLSKEAAIKHWNWMIILAEVHLALAMVKIYGEWDKTEQGNLIEEHWNLIRT